MSDGAFDDLARHRRAAYQFGDDIDFRMRHNLAPVFRAKGGAKPRAGGSRAAAEGLYVQWESELECYLIGVLGEDRERAGSDIPQPHNSYVYRLHLGTIIRESRSGSQ